MISILLLFRPFPLSSYLQEADKYIFLKKAVLQGTVCANLWQRSMGRLAKKNMQAAGVHDGHEEKITVYPRIPSNQETP